ncbi:MAG: Npt1/Npt2 family nucleotide transporter [Candidatus Algichlamydia australiensis]|nr:Npt1/Npt2 family nucleotide transporter [Chlamydiales bacterium]
MATDAQPRLGKIRSFLWPIYRSELRTFLPMFVIYFLICMNYTLLRAAKDALVITAKGSGAEALPFIKVWAILPMALLFTAIYSRFANRYGRDRVFYIMVSIFLGFFALFAFAIYPNIHALHPHGFCDSLATKLPDGFNGLISLFRNWTFTLFYCMSELWGTIVMTVLFWGFANQMINVGGAKRFYAPLLMGANIASFIAGFISLQLSSKALSSLFPSSQDPWGKTISLITLVILISGVAILFAYRWLSKNGLDTSAVCSNARKEGKPKFKMGLRENFAFLSKSKYLICIAIIVFTYNVSINMIEVVWKDQLKQLLPDPNDFSAYMGKVFMVMGAFSTFISIFICGSSIRRFGWTFSAMISPIAILITGCAFFSFLLFRESGFGSMALMLGSTPLALAVFFGSMQNCIARACKYTLFDATKEMAFIPLDSESKLKGKAAIDGVGSRLGKSGSSLIHQAFLIPLKSVTASAPYIAGCFVLIAGAWIAATRSLGRQFQSKTQPEPALINPKESAQPELG